MPTWLIVFLFALGAVALFVVGMKCAVHETREADGSAGCSDTHTAAGCSGNCSACDIEEAGHKK